MLLLHSLDHISSTYRGRVSVFCLFISFPIFVVVPFVLCFGVNIFVLLESYLRLHIFYLSSGN